MIYHHVFGPVASRRLGVSLGVDLVPPKTCSLDCVYCEARKTTCHTQERREYVPINAVIAELDDYLRAKPELDFITFSGAGEPTLNSGIGRVVDFLKDRHPEYKICLLTNGCSLNDPALAAEIRRVDRVVPSLDASCEAEFQAINRPAVGLTFAPFVKALTDFCKHCESEVYLELFIVPGVNDSPESQRRFAELIRPMKVDMVQLNTLDRPGTELSLRPAPPEIIRQFIRVISPVAPVEAVGKFRYRSGKADVRRVEPDEMERKILELVERRPATLADLAVALDLPETRLHRIVGDLFERGELAMERGERGDFYQLPGL